MALETNSQNIGAACPLRNERLKERRIREMFDYFSPISLTDLPSFTNGTSIAICTCQIRSHLYDAEKLFE